MKDETNWVGLQKRFISESSLSDFIATYPSRLEDGLTPYPNAKVREKVFPDKSRSDVLPIDKAGNPVVVECKQAEPTLAHIKQLRGYMKNVKKATGQRPRGILVHMDLSPGNVYMPAILSEQATSGAPNQGAVNIAATASP